MKQPQMKAQIEENNRRKNQQNSVIMQLSDLTELTDQELELVVGGSGSAALVVSSAALLGSFAAVNNLLTFIFPSWVTNPLPGSPGSPSPGF